MITISANNTISNTISGKTVARVEQTADKTRLFRLEGDEVALPHARYALSCSRPASGIPGREQFEADATSALGL